MLVSGLQVQVPKHANRDEVALLTRRALKGLNEKPHKCGVYAVKSSDSWKTVIITPRKGVRAEALKSEGCVDYTQTKRCLGGGIERLVHAATHAALRF